MQAARSKAGIGMRVEIELLSRTGDNEKMSFTIVPDESADYGSGYLGASTPLAKALTGKAEGETIPYELEELYAVRILRIEHNPEIQLADLAAKRLTRFNKAVRDAERSNAINFASSFSGKWGDYDPDSLPIDQEKE